MIPTPIYPALLGISPVKIYEVTSRRGRARDPIGPTTEISPYFTAWRLEVVDMVESRTTQKIKKLS